MSHVDFGRYKRIVQYFWDPEPKNDDGLNLSIWCLGKEYQSKTKASSIATSSSFTLDEDKGKICKEDGSYQLPKRTTLTSANGGQEVLLQTPAYTDNGDREWPKDFLDDFESRLWFTYRSNFPNIPRSPDPQASNLISLSVRLRSQLADHSGFTSDTGWGCMIRSGQSLLANALLRLRLGREWRRGTHLDEERNLLSMFADDPRAPFSIHKFVKHGASACGKHPGEWFGPSATARCIRALSLQYTSRELNVYVTGDGADVYEDSFMKIATADDGSFIPTLILVGIRLGIDRVTPAYREALKAVLQLPQSIGIAGGRPSSSHYFIAVQGDKFFYLDPHQTRVALPLHEDAASYTDEEMDSCHTRRLRRLSIEEMDPSMLIGFLITDREDWERWRAAVTHVAGKPVVNVADVEPIEFNDSGERQSAIDEVETFDDENENDSEGELVERPA